MPELDHLIVPSRDRRASARHLAELLDVPWEPESMGIFSAVYVSDSLTLDFGDSDEFEVEHYCFRVTPEEFDAIHSRIVQRGIVYRSTPHGPMDMQINTSMGGRILYWFGPEGHNWEILTQSYARRSPSAG